MGQKAPGFLNPDRGNAEQNLSIVIWPDCGSQSAQDNEGPPRLCYETLLRLDVDGATILRRERGRMEVRKGQFAKLVEYLKSLTADLME